MASEENLENFFRPSKVVLVRSSTPAAEVGMDKPEVSERVRRNLLRWGGEVLDLDLTDEGWEEVLGGMGEMGGALCVVATAGEEVFRAMEMLARRGVKDYIVLPGGLSRAEIRELKRVVREMGLRLLGPNSIFGVVDSRSGFNTTFEEALETPPGGSSFLFQSGGVGAAVIDQILENRIGIRRLVFLGNKYFLKEGDLLEEFLRDKKTSAVGIYTEGMNLREVGLNRLREFSLRKPITLLKGGKSEAGKRRAALHTDSLSKDEEVFAGVLKGLGFTVVEDVDLLALQTHFYSLNPSPPGGRGVYIISNVGGPAIELSDKLIARGLSLPEFPEELSERWRRELRGVEPLNPVDLIADARWDRYTRAIDLLIEGGARGTLVLITALKSTLLEPSDVVKILTHLEEKSPEGLAVVLHIPGVVDFRRVLEVVHHPPYFMHHSSRVISEVLSNWLMRWKVLSQ